MKTNLFIVVPNWNGEDYIEACLSSLEKQTVEAEVVVVDNGSRDKSLEMVNTRFPRVHIIKHEENKGFAGGVNSGIRFALENGAKYIALLNNDAVANKEWAHELLQVLQKNPKAGIATGKLLREDGKHIDSTGEFFKKRCLPSPRGRDKIDTGQYDSAESVFAATGGASLYRASLFEEIGFFDERFFAYFEDVDLSFRARLAGHDILYTPRAVATHKVGGTSSKLGNFAQYHANKNYYYLYIKNMPFPLSIEFLPYFVYQAARSFVASIKKGRFLNYVHAMCTMLLHLPGILLSRWRIQRNRKISTSEIKSWVVLGGPPSLSEAKGEKK